MVAASPSSPKPARLLGRFELRQLLGKSARSMVWLVHDPRANQELMLVMPRVQPATPQALERWTAAVRKAGRLNHPHLAPLIEAGEQDRWPYAAYDRLHGQTLAETLTAQGEPAADAARWMAQALEGLAFTHEAGAAHHDLQTHMLVRNEQGQVRLLGFEVASEEALPAEDGAVLRSLSVTPEQLRAQRDAAQRDVLALGLVLHHLLAGAPALDEPDTGKVIDRLPPQGRDIVRLPWSTAHQVPEPLRAIVNRASDRQERQRYRNARTLARALTGWLELDAQQGGDAHAQLIDRVWRIGALPALPGGAARAARLASMEKERTIELAELVLKDFALAFELLRMVNTAQVRGSQIAGNGPVLTVRRAIAMVGLDGVRRAAAGLRGWPGPLSDVAATELAALIDHVKRAGRVAQRLRPAGYDAEVVYLVTLLQSLGRMVVQYHFPEEAQQIRRLMQPAPAAKAGEPDEPGLPEEAAAFAVLGSDIESMGAAVARHWGLDEAVLHMVRRLPPHTPVRTPDNDDDVLRAVASAANEAVDAIGLPARQAVAAIERVAQRYGRILDLTREDLQSALTAAGHGEATLSTDDDPDIETPDTTLTGSAR